MKDLYIQALANSESLDNIDSIIETASNDDSITNIQYEMIYTLALEKYHDILGF